MCLVNKNLLIEIFNENYRNVIISDIESVWDINNSNNAFIYDAFS